MSAAATPATSDSLAVGLQPGTRYQCEGCGNLTRFDVSVTERGVRFWHAEVSGAGFVESTADHEIVVESVTCRWCGSADRVRVVPAPANEPTD